MSWSLIGFLTLIAAISIPWAYVVARMVTRAIIRTIEEKRNEESTP